MRTYSMFHIPVMSFFSKDLYKDLGTTSKRTGFAYLLLLLAVCWLALMIKFQIKWVDIVDHDQTLADFIEQVPAITIQNGKASMEGPQPYLIRDPETEKPFAVIDTTGAVTSLDQSEALILLTVDKIYFKKDARETRMYDLSGIKEFHLDQTRIRSWLTLSKFLLVPICYIFALFGSYVFRLGQVLFYAVIGLVMVSALKMRLAYTALLRIAVAAVTPVILVRTLLSLLDVKIPWSGFWFFFIAAGYLFFGIYSNREPLQAPPAAP